MSGVPNAGHSGSNYLLPPDIVQGGGRGGRGGGGGGTPGQPAALQATIPIAGFAADVKAMGSLPRGSLPEKGHQ